MLEKALILLFMFNIAHYLGDNSPLLTKDMIKSKQNCKGIMEMLDIFEHAIIHVFLFIIMIYIYYYFVLKQDIFDLITDNGWNKYSISLLLLLISHFVIDLAKAYINKYMPKTADIKTNIHWQLFNLDQFLHQCIILCMVYILLK